MKNNNKPIGIFDSGLGGLTVLKELKERMPRESFIYFGDTAHLPYGNKSNTSIIKYSKEISQYLYSQNIKSLIIACNTASAIAYTQINKLFSIPVFNVMDASVQCGLKMTKTKRIGVIGTEATIRSNAYQNKIHSIDKNIEITAKACPLFVPLVEENLINQKFTKTIVRYYLKEIMESNADTLILGCTHYPLLIDVIRQTVGKKIQIISSSVFTAKHVQKALSRRKILADNNNILRNKFYVSDKPKEFNYLAQTFLKESPVNVKKILL